MALSQRASRFLSLTLHMIRAERSHPVAHPSTVRHFGGATRVERTLALLMALFGMAMRAHAAGGHHAVDDADILEPGQCQVETWVDRELGGARSLLQVGPACRIGPIEIGINLNRAWAAGAGSNTGYGPQIKWAGALTDDLRAGVVLSAAWRGRSANYVASTLIVPLTWKPVDPVLVHVNVGRDFRKDQTDSERAGAAIEWMPLPAWAFVAERFREGGANYWRAGARWTIATSLNVDLSHARGLAGAPSLWTLGVTWGWG